MDLNKPSIITLLNGKETMEYDEQLSSKITLLAAQINAATYLFLKLLGEFDRRAGWAGDGIRSCAHWLDWKCGIAGCAARERVRIAHCLDELPLINKAFEAGEVSYSKVREMTRVATNDNEDYLLMIAQHGTASHIAKLVRKYRRVEKNMDMEQLEALQQSREFTYFQDGDGMWEIRARLPQDEGGLVVKAIDEIMRQQDKPLNKPLGHVEENVSAETNSPEPEIMETCNYPQK
ncbi:MAG: DUF222 domain-containing protein, partial [Algicola sp.]|nr:DUF222 domain-containing protein [Algicola sp.]